MHDQPAPDFPLPYLPEEQPPRKARRRYRHLLWVFAGVGVALTIAVGAYLLLHKPGNSGPPTERLITYYYRDGKTILWQGVEPFAAESPSFVHRVYDEITTIFSTRFFEGKKDWKIVTTLDLPLQTIAKEQLEAQREQLASQRAEEAAVMAQDVTTGQIVAWVVGFDDVIKTRDENRLLSPRTQVGTLATPLVYAAYIDSNKVGAGTVLTDEQGPLPGYNCPEFNPCLQNFDHRYLGQMTLRQALGGLRLVPAVKLATSLIADDTSPGGLKSINKTLDVMKEMMGDKYGTATLTCHRAGAAPYEHLPNFDERNPCFGAAAYGAGLYSAPQDLVHAYATLSNDGSRLTQTGVLGIKLNDKLFTGYPPAKAKQIIKEDTSYIISDILSDPVASYQSRKQFFRVGNDIKASTFIGTAEDRSMTSAVQYTSKYVVGFWAYGGQDPSRRLMGFSETLTMPPVWGWLNAAHQIEAPPERPVPAGIKTLPAPVITFDGSPTPGPGPATDLYPSWYE